MTSTGKPASMPGEVTTATVVTYPSLLDEPRFRASEVRCPHCGQGPGQACIGANERWFAKQPHKGRVAIAETLPPRRCYRYDWCGHTELTNVSYGDGRTYWRCPIGHVWPDPPPVDVALLDAGDEE